MEILAIISIKDSTPIAFENIYEDGDRWEKVQGCEACPEERRKRCCGNCGMLTPDGFCSWQTGKSAISQKPFKCVVIPNPSKSIGDCCQIFKCTKGSNKGKFRHVADSGEILR